MSNKLRPMPSEIEDLLIYLTNTPEKFLLADGFERAIIGYDMKLERVIYSVAKCIDILVTYDAMSEEEAIEYFQYNVEGAWVGEHTPIWCYDRVI